jgi:hypothetical protein
MTKLSANKQMILEFVQKNPNLTPSEIGGRLAPEGSKNANGWGRDNVRSMVGTGHLKIEDDGTVAVAVKRPTDEEIFGKGVPYVAVDEADALDALDAPTDSLLTQFRKKLGGLFGVSHDGPEISDVIATMEHESGPLSPDALTMFNEKSLDGITGDFKPTKKTFAERMADVSQALRKFGATAASTKFNFGKPEAELTVKRERDLQLQALRRMPKLLRQIPKKGTTNRRILVEFKSEVDKRIHQYHATKGWRSTRA